MTDKTAEDELKRSCAAFYQSDIVRMLLGDVMHPGGLALTYHLGTLIELKQTDQVLDVACGRGASAVHLAKRFGCHVTGVDYGAKSIAAAETHANAQDVAHLSTFCHGDAESLPFGDGAFDAVISECSFCTFPDKATAASEMARVLRRSGQLALADITIHGPLPDDIPPRLLWVASVAGAGTPEHYTATLEEAGFTDFLVEDRSDALADMANEVRHKLAGVALAALLGKLRLNDILAHLNLGHLGLNEGKKLARRALELIETGVVGYTLITAKRE